MVPALEARTGEPQDALRVEMITKRIPRHKDVSSRYARRGGDEAALWAGDVTHARELRERQGFKIEELQLEPERRRRPQEGDVRGEAATAPSRLQVEGVHAPRAARPETRVAGAHSTPSTATSRV